MLNLEAVDKLDPQQRKSSPNQELFAQGCGNILCGMLGGIPVTSVIVRSSVNINAGARTKVSAVFHGVLLALCVVFISSWLNLIPLAGLAAILLHTGAKLVHPKLLVRMWKDGPYQFLPFIATLVGIVLTDLIFGVGIGSRSARRASNRGWESKTEFYITSIRLVNCSNDLPLRMF